jgi:hypothetical protein
MKYFVLLAGEDRSTGPWDSLSAEEQAAEMARHGEFAAACEERADVELTITDGPFAEAAEQIGGYYVIEAPDLDTVIDLCRILPAYDMDIRPVMDLG